MGSTRDDRHAKKSLGLLIGIVVLVILGLVFALLS
jgi:hypothetical protein